MTRGWARGQNLGHRLFFLFLLFQFSFMESFVFEQQEQHVFRVDFLSVALDYRAQCPMVELGGQNLGHLRFLLFFLYGIESFNLSNR